MSSRLCGSTKQPLLSGRRSGLRLRGLGADCQHLIIRSCFPGSCVQCLHFTEGSLSGSCRLGTDQRRPGLGQRGGRFVGDGAFVRLLQWHLLSALRALT